MLNFKITQENPESIKDFEHKLQEAFPDKDPEQMYDILHLYDEAYLSAKEYFAYYFPMTTKTVINYINSHKLGTIWQFITDAIFDEGINALFSLIDGQSSQYRDVLRRSEKIFGFPISDYGQDKDYIKKIRIYRNNVSAHFGKDYFEDNSRIRFDEPIIMLEHLRRDRENFNQKYLNIADLSYDEFKRNFAEKIPIIIEVLNAPLDTEQIRKELSEYLSSVIEAEFKDMTKTQ